VLAGHRPGRSSAQQVTVFDSVGFALEDFSALGFMRDAAHQLGIGEFIHLVPRAADPKDLFGMLRVTPGVAELPRELARA
jgi:ornithine cyclodeaminase